MKNCIRFAFYLAIVFIAFSCSKNFEQNQDEDSTQFEDLEIAANFDWQTSETINFQITQENASQIRITSSDGKQIFHEGFYNRLSEYYNVSINIPKHITSILINSHIVEITGNNIVVNLDLKSNNFNIEKNEQLFIEGLVSSWHFDENTGTNVLDSEGLNNGTLSGGIWVDGISGSALSFDGNGGQVEVQNSNSLNITNDQISFSCWFKLDFVGDDGAFVFTNMKYVLRIDKNGKFTFALYNPDWASLTIPWADRIIDTDWHHIVTSYDGSTMKIYLDNQLMAEKTASGNLRSNTSPIRFGSQTTSNNFDGTLDEIEIYNRSLTVAEIGQLYQNTPNPGNGPESLVSYWDFNENAGSTLIDETGGNNGTIIGASWSSGINGACLSFDGTDDYVQFDSPQNLNFSNALSIMTWVRAEEHKTAKIAQKGDWDGYGIGQDVWNGWKAGIRLANNTSKSLDWNNGRPVLGEWYHIALTYNGSVLKLFVNGQLTNTENVSGDLKVNSRPFSIGSDNGGQKFFNGRIDEIKVFGAALSHTEIQAIYQNTGTSADSDGDGIADDNDAFPNDPGRAFTNNFPSANYSSLAFEDLWPGRGDYDFNDLVIDYHFTTTTNAHNKVSEIYGNFVVKAIGAGLSNGFGFQLPGTALDPAELMASGSNLQDGYITLYDNGCEAAQEKITVIVFDNAKNILQAPSGFGVNVEPGAPYITPDTVKIIITFTPGLYSIEDIQLHNFNPFLIVNSERGKEIHLPDYLPTSLADESYFGSQHDDSNPQSGKYYKTANNLPWAINITESFDYTNEKSKISEAYLKFADWAISSGTMYTDWFQDKSTYRDESHIYQIP
jgi:LruC domain-containing protein